jgi:hypothetical protein
MSVLGKADTIQAEVQQSHYKWAQNQHKANIAAKQVHAASLQDPSVKYDDETIKARYCELQGVLIDEPRANPENREHPSVTAKGGLKVSTKGGAKNAPSRRPEGDPIVVPSKE